MFKRFVKKYNLPSYRVSQIHSQYYRALISSWEELSTWPKDLREKLKEEIHFSELTYISKETSESDNTIKVLFKTEKGNFVESVLMKEKDRNTVCVSCMSGCPVGCIFCATGQMGLNELLNENQILDQVLYFARELKLENEKVTNIVYMGMGEPMYNLESVAHSINILTDPEKVALGRRRATVSTAGDIQNLKKFLNMKLGVKLAVSLHAPNQELRDMLMPKISIKNPLSELFALLDSYVNESNKRITYEYVLLRDLNDTKEHAKELATLLKDRLALVNLINYNENECLPFKKSLNSKQFQDILLKSGITCTIRKSYGEDIKGACGQLGLANNPK